MINVNKAPGMRVLELGCGASRNPAADVAVDVRFVPGVTDFAQDLTKPLELSSGEFDLVLCSYALEHLPFREVPGLLRETLRVLKPGGRAVFAVPNTRAQLEWIASHPEGWDGKDFFTSASEKLFGSQDMPDGAGQDHNTHRCYFDPETAVALFRAAGFADVVVTPYGARQTDMIVDAKKPEQDTDRQRYDAMRRGQTPKVAVEQDYVSKMKRADQTNLQGVPPLVGSAAKPFDAAAQPNVLGSNVTRVLDDPEAALAHAKPVDDPDPDKLPPALAPGSLRLPDFHPEAAFRGADVPVPQDAPEPPVNASGAPAAPACPTPAPPPAHAAGATVAPPAGGEEEYDPGQTFDKMYFDGGRGKWGGYAGLGSYRDFPCHYTTAQHVLARRPESVLEIGAGRGYVLKRLHDAGVIARGIDVSRHCHLTRVCEDVWLRDITDTPWVVTDQGRQGPLYDLCFGITVLEHIPEELLPGVVRECTRTCRRGLFGITTHPADAGDRTRVTVRSLDWWRALFAEHAPGWPVEILDRDALEAGPLSADVLSGDGKVKLNLGCHTNQFFGWDNIDVGDLGQWSAQQGLRYRRHDLRAGLPYPTGGVDLIFMHHFLEHLTYEEGRRLLNDCRRALKPGGAMRVVVPDAALLCGMYADRAYQEQSLSAFHEISDGAENAPTAAGKLWELLIGGDHRALYDEETLVKVLEGAGFVARRSSFRSCNSSSAPDSTCEHPGLKQMLRETTEMDFGGTSLFVDAVPKCE